MSVRLIFLLLINYFLETNYVVQACSCTKFTYRPYMERIKYLVKLPDTTKLDSLALIGTHLSLSYNAEEEELRTQDLNIVQQLKYGIRVLDISVRPDSKYFKLYTGHAYLNLKLHNILHELDEFLDDNPGEFIIMFIRQEHSAGLNASKNNCEIIDNYIDDVWGGWRMVKNWTRSDPIGMYRNRILLASPDRSFTGCTLNVIGKCDTTKITKLYTQDKLYNTHNKLIFIKHSIKVVSRCVKSFKCLIHDISFIDDGYDRRTIAKDGGYSIDKYCIEPINLQMTNSFENPHCELTIVIADYPTQELIDKINDSNFKNSSWRSGWE